MTIHGIEKLLQEHAFFADLEPAYVELLAGCASNVSFAAGETILREGEPADRFFLIRHGRVALEIRAPGRGRLTIQTIHEGEILGWSWIVEPYRSHQDARALDLTRAIAFDAACMRQKFDADPRFGLTMMQHFVPLIVDRLHGTRMQLLDVYGNALHA